MFEDEEFDIDLDILSTQTSIFSPDDSVDDSTNQLSVKTNYVSSNTIPKRQFPGPAGVPESQCSQENLNDNYDWIKALDDLGVKWSDPDSLLSKYSVCHIKQKTKPGSSISSIRIPILVVQIKSLDRSRVDPICRLRDPNGEVGGSIHRDVIKQFGPDIQVGSILVLRNVTVLISTSQYVNITANNLVSIYLQQKVLHINSVNLKDMEVEAEQVDKVRQLQLKEIQDASLVSAEPVGSPQLPAFSVPGQ